MLSGRFPADRCAAGRLAVGGAAVGGGVRRCPVRAAVLAVQLVPGVQRKLSECSVSCSPIAAVACNSRQFTAVILAAQDQYDESLSLYGLLLRCFSKPRLPRAAASQKLMLSQDTENSTFVSAPK